MTFSSQARPPAVSGKRGTRPSDRHSAARRRDDFAGGGRPKTATMLAALSRLLAATAILLALAPSMQHSGSAAHAQTRQQYLHGDNAWEIPLQSEETIFLEWRISHYHAMLKLGLACGGRVQSRFIPAPA
jgi:hypothetical protein